jgi:hypothetical protein
MKDPGSIDMKMDPLMRSLVYDQRWPPFLAKMGFAD